MNYTNPGAVSHNEILQMYKDYIDPEFKWSNFSVEEQAKVIVAARSNNLLDTMRVSPWLLLRCNAERGVLCLVDLAPVLVCICICIQVCRPVSGSTNKLQLPAVLQRQICRG